MEDRERTESGQFVKRVMLEDVLDVFDQVRGPVITSSDVAEELECTTEAARQKLTRLVDQDRLAKRKTGRTTVYWRQKSGSDTEISFEMDEDVVAGPELEQERGWDIRL